MPFARSSLNHNDVFVLDTESTIFQFNGATSSIQERGKALEVVQYIKDTYHDGKCEVIIIGMEANKGFASQFQSSTQLCSDDVNGHFGFVELCSTNSVNKRIVCIDENKTVFNNIILSIPIVFGLDNFFAV